jgi:protocatechuate 3,4-dioxygenase beta subunit
MRALRSWISSSSSSRDSGSSSAAVARGKFGPALIFLIALLTITAADAQVTRKEPIVGGPCDGCEAVFEGIPAKFASVARIAPVSEPGEPLRIEGIVKDAQGKPVPGIVVYAYHTNVKGLYPSGSTRHGSLRGWAISDAAGRYAFDTIRPGGYPNSQIPQHVHMHVIEPGRCTYYIDELLFDDDPRLTPAERKGPGRGGVGLVVPKKDANGRWLVTRDVVLGAAIPGYPRREATP